MSSSYRLKRRISAWIIVFFLFIFLLLNGYIFSIINILNIDLEIQSIDSNDERSSGSLVLCVSFARNDYHETAARATINTWGKRCDRFYFVTRLQNTSIELMMIEKYQNTSDINWSNINMYTFDVFTYLENQLMFQQYHWFLRASDQAFVIVPNLHRLIEKLIKRQIDRTAIVYVGDASRLHDEFNYTSAGSVMLFNRQALRMIAASQTDQNGNEVYPCQGSIQDDHEFIECLKKIGIQVNSIMDDTLFLSQNLSTYRTDQRLQVSHKT